MRRLLTRVGPLFATVTCYLGQILAKDMFFGPQSSLIWPGLSCLQSGWAEQKLERRARTRPYSPASAKQNRGGKQQTARTTARPDSTIPPRRRRTGARDPEHKGRQQPYPPTIAHQKQSVPHSPETMMAALTTAGESRAGRGSSRASGRVIQSEPCMYIVVISYLLGF
jgi:hypothetical protein